MLTHTYIAMFLRCDLSYHSVQMWLHFARVHKGSLNCIWGSVTLSNDHIDTYLHAGLYYRKFWNNTEIIIWYPAFSVVISKLTMLPECKLTAQNVQRIQFHQHQASEYFPTLELFTQKRVIVSATANHLSLYCGIGFSGTVLN